MSTFTNTNKFFVIKVIILLDYTGQTETTTSLMSVLYKNLLNKSYTINHINTLCHVTEF